MTPPAATNTPLLWPLFVYAVVVFILVGVMLGLSYVLGQRHKEPATGQPYEAGIVSTGSARLRMDVRFYLVAVFFVVFDLEAAFLFVWAVALRDIGWPGYVEGLIFIGVLFVALIYLWRLGALDWGTIRRKGRVDRKGTS